MSLLGIIDALLHVLGMGFFNGYSASKTLWFFVLLILIFCFVHFKVRNTFLKSKKWFLYAPLILAVVLIGLNLFTSLTFLSYNHLPVNTLAYVMYDANVGSFTGTSITHNHAFKAMLSPIAAVVKGDFDWGLEFFAFMPSWISIVYVVGLVLELIFILSSLLVFNSLILGQLLSKKAREKEFATLIKSHTLFLIWLCACAVYLTSKTIVDGGILTREFFVGFLLLVLVFGAAHYFINHKIKGILIVFGLGLVFDVALRLYLGLQVYPFSIPLFLQAFANALIAVGGFVVFIFGIGFVLHFMHNKKILPALAILVIVLISASVSFSLSEAAADKLDTFSTISSSKAMYAPIAEGTKLLAEPKALRADAPITVLDANRELWIVQTTKNTTLSEISAWSDNTKTIQYIFPWTNRCLMLILPQTVKIKTSQTLTPTQTPSLVSGVQVERCTPSEYCDYHMSFYYSYCVTDTRAMIVDYLKKSGLSQFMLVS